MAVAVLLLTTPLLSPALSTLVVGGVLLSAGLAIEIWIFLLSLTALWRPPWKDRRAVIAALTVNFIFGIVPVAAILIALIVTMMR